DPNLPDLLPVVIDQTLQRIRRERRLAQVERSLRLLESAVSNARDGVAVLSLEAAPQIIYANPAFVDLLRLDVGNGEPLPAGWAAILSEPSPTILIEKLKRGEPCQGRRAHEPDGVAPATLDATLTPVQDEDGRWTHCIAILRDVSHQVRLEERIREAQKMEAIGQLAGGVAHDFNNLLTVIMGHTGLLLKRPALDKGLHNGLSRVQQAAVHGSQLVNQLLTFSRQQLLRPQIVDFSHVVHDISRMLQQAIGNQRSLQMSLSDDALPVYIDPAQLQRVLLNLAVNARDAMGPEGTLQLETRRATLPTEDAVVEELPELSYGLLVFRDDGAGMTPTVQERIFEPFFTTKPPGKGTGLGLSTAYAIIQQSRGLIRVHSAPGVGTTFFIYLPLSEQPPTASTDFAPQTILVAEDDDVVRQLTRLTLERVGFRVLEASGGMAAQRMFFEHPGTIDLLISDVHMPDLDGRVLARSLRKRRPDLPILLISGFFRPAEEDVQDGFPILLKPFASDELVQRAQQLLNAERES
ncbi:MAG: ATP-binding protein, partial [Myxococcota bacterium]